MELSSVFLILAGIAAYAVLNLWLPLIAKKDMDRRGEPGWAYDLGVWWCLPVGLVSWWVARRRYPLLEERRKPTDA